MASICTYQIGYHELNRLARKQNTASNRAIISFFSRLSALTAVVQHEISTAFKHLQDKSKIIVIYDRVKNMKYSEHCTEVTINAAKESADNIVRKVIHQIKENQGPSRTAAKKKEEMLNAVGGILLIGLGFLILDAFFNSRN